MDPLKDIDPTHERSHKILGFVLSKLCLSEDQIPYDTASNRDRDLKRGQKIDFRYKGVQIPVQTAKFEDPGKSRPYVYVVERWPPGKGPRHPG